MTTPKRVPRRPGPAPVPAEVKRRRGTMPTRGDAVTLLPPATSTPDPLRPLDDAGADLWARVWGAGARWISVDADADLVQLTCEAVDEREALRSVIIAGTGDFHDRAALRALDTQILACLSMLGFTPTDRTRLGVAEVMAASTLERLRDAQDRRNGRR